MKMFLVFVVLLALYTCGGAQRLPREAFETVPQMISSAGYPVSKHRVTTEDGYSLQLFRIPAGRRTPRRSDSAKGKRAVLLVHGMLGGCDNFLLMGPDKSLGYMLADAGYDVWLGNLRGTSFSVHQNLTRADPEFWNYSFEEHGKYDLPAIIDKILNITKLDKIAYVGHSMGTTSFFVMMSERPEYNNHIVTFIALGPAVYLANLKPSVQLLTVDLDLINNFRAQGRHSTDFVRNQWLALATACTSGTMQRNFCIRLHNNLVGEDDDQLDLKIFPIAMARLQTASWKELAHYAKVVRTNVFTAWGDGTDNTIIPYKLSNVKVPVVLMYGNNDKLTEKSQVLRLAEELKSSGVLEEVIECPWPKFNHIDFVLAKDVRTLVNIPVIKILNRMYSKYYT